MHEAPEEITIANLEVLVMPNGEIICKGETLGWVTAFGEQTEIAKSLTPIRNGITGEAIV
jgi:hypothetical protein